jgi:hypothetical protein
LGVGEGREREGGSGGGGETYNEYQVKKGRRNN